MYHCLPNNEFYWDNYCLTAIRPQDIYHIKDWRNAQMDILRQDRLLTDDDQKKYFENIVYPTFEESQPKQILFSFMQNNNCIGYGGLVHINWNDRRGEISFLLSPERVANPQQYIADFTAYLALIKQIAFKILHLNRLFTETYDIRPLHISIIEKSGFSLEGRMRQHVFIKETYIDSLIHGILNNEYNLEK